MHIILITTTCYKVALFSKGDLYHFIWLPDTCVRLIITVQWLASQTCIPFNLAPVSADCSLHVCLCGRYIHRHLNECMNECLTDEPQNGWNSCLWQLHLWDDCLKENRCIVRSNHPLRCLLLFWCSSLVWGNSTSHYQWLAKLIPWNMIKSANDMNYCDVTNIALFVNWYFVSHF